MNYKDKIILITRGFPYGRGEAFLYEEIKVLSQKFSKIIIFAQKERIYDGFNKMEKRELPDNVLVKDVPSYFKRKNLFSLLSIFFSQYLINECTYLLVSGKLRINTLKSMFDYLLRAKFLYKYINSNIDFEHNDKIYAYSYWSYEEPLALLQLTNKLIYKVLARVHGGDLYQELHLNSYLPFRNLYVSKLDQIYTVSQKGIQYLSDQFPLNSDKFKLSRLGTKTLSFQQFKETEKVKILSIGALYSIKRVWLIIDALALLENTAIEWHHFGTGPDEMSIHKLALDKLKNQLINYQFHGYVTNVEIQEYLTSNYFELIINTSISEGIPVSIMEAYSVGIPAIATNVGGTSEIVNIENGHLLPPNPLPEEVAEAISNYHHLIPEEKNKKRLAAFNTWEEKYNAEKNYTSFVEDIASL